VEGNGEFVRTACTDNAPGWPQPPWHQPCAGAGAAKAGAVPSRATRSSVRAQATTNKGFLQLKYAPTHPSLYS